MSRPRSCPKVLLLRSKVTGELRLATVPCESSRRCTYCAQLRARRLARALRSSAEESRLKVVFLTVTFKPSLKVDMRNVKTWRHRILEVFRRRAIASAIPLDYVCAIERHKSGAPHLHFLIAWTTVRAVRDVARGAVKNSHCVAKLARDDHVETYLSKYVSKQGEPLTSSHAVARRAMQSVARGLYELIAVKPSHMTVAEWLDSLNIWWYDVAES
jgi:hypothetical protein